MKSFCDVCKKTNNERTLVHLELSRIDCTGDKKDLFFSPLETKFREPFKRLSLNGIDLCTEHFLMLLSLGDSAQETNTK